jgi:hypothetical protein
VVNIEKDVSYIKRGVLGCVRSLGCSQRDCFFFIAFWYTISPLTITEGGNITYTVNRILRILVIAYSKNHSNVFMLCSLELYHATVSQGVISVSLKSI